MSEPTYKIVRFYQDDTPAEVLVRGLTRAQAQAHCQRDDTRGDGWFDGFASEDDDLDDEPGFMDDPGNANWRDTLSLDGRGIPPCV